MANAQNKITTVFQYGSQQEKSLIKSAAKIRKECANNFMLKAALEKAVQTHHEYEAKLKEQARLLQRVGV
jgi:uncharacterized protein (DUF1778 family)